MKLSEVYVSYMHSVLIFFSIYTYWTLTHTPEKMIFEEKKCVTFADPLRGYLIMTMMN